MGVNSEVSQPARAFEGGINRPWAGLALLLMANIYILAWVGRGLVKYLSAHSLLEPLLIAVFIAALLALGLAARWGMGAGQWALAKAVGLFALSQALALIVTRTLPESIHVAEYELLAFSVFRALEGKYSGRALYSNTMFIILLAGWSDEAMQSLVPDRYYDLLDVLLNMAAGGFGLAIAHIMSNGDKGPRP